MAGTAKVVLASCSKHIVQILQLLAERSLCFSFCLNKNELLISSGFGLLFQNLDLEGGSTLMKENSRLTFIIANMLDRQPSRASVEFRRVSTALAMQHISKLSEDAKRAPLSLSRHNSDIGLNQQQEEPSSTQKHIRAIMSRFTSSSGSSAKSHRSDDRRATVPVLPREATNTSRTSLSSIHSEPSLARSEPARSPGMQMPITNSSKPRKQRPQSSVKNSSTNLDYLPLEPMITSAYPFAASAMTSGKNNASSTDWERLLGSLDNGQTNIYDGIYGGPPIEALNESAPPPADANLVWSPADMWSINNTNGTNTAVPQSVLSFSDESLTSGGDEFPDLTQCASHENYKGIWIPDMSPGAVDTDAFGISTLDGGFGL
jgi:hypothetical protein